MQRIWTKYQSTAIFLVPQEPLYDLCILSFLRKVNHSVQLTDKDAQINEKTCKSYYFLTQQLTMQMEKKLGIFSYLSFKFVSFSCISLFIF